MESCLESERQKKVQHLHCFGRGLDVPLTPKYESVAAVSSPASVPKFSITSTQYLAFTGVLNLEVHILCDTSKDLSKPYIA